MNYIFNVAKANIEIANLKEELASVSKDRDAQVTALKSFETAHKDYIESAQTAEAMKEAHKKELETVKSEYEAKLSEKDKELTAIKESITKTVETVKAEADKTISTVKESVAAETIAIVASQGTNVAIDNMTSQEVSDNVTKHNKMKYIVVSHLNKK